MLLDIIIPQYNENEEMIEPLLDSILEQQNIDFGCLYGFLYVFLWTDY